MSVLQRYRSSRVKCVDMGRKTWGECVKDDMKLLGLQSEWAMFRTSGICEDLIFFHSTYFGIAYACTAFWLTGYGANV